MRIEKPLWHEGLILTPQHFQQQDRWTEFALRQHAAAALAEPWGTLSVDVDEEALTTGRLKLTRLKLCFPDGTPIDTGVTDALPALEITEQIPHLCKIGAPDDIEHIINSALLGIPLKPVARVPAAIPVRLDNQYFALDANSPLHARMMAARACQIYLPASVAEASLELYAVLR